MGPASQEELLLSAFERMKFTLEGLKASEITPSRELSLAATNLEQAMMWLNKDRANKGYLEKSPTHV